MDWALSGSQFAPKIVRFLKKKKDNEEIRALFAQHAGKPVWEKRIKDTDSYMINRKRTVTTQQTLKKYINLHRSVFVCLSESTDCVSHKITNKCTRVGYLVGGIDSKGAKVISALT